MGVQRKGWEESLAKTCVTLVFCFVFLVVLQVMCGLSSLTRDRRDQISSSPYLCAAQMLGLNLWTTREVPLFILYSYDKNKLYSIRGGSKSFICINMEINYFHILMTHLIIFFGIYILHKVLCWKWLHTIPDQDFLLIISSKS